jgi:hypothetical protein
MRILPGRRQEPFNADWPSNACDRIRKMRSLGATWKIVGAAFDCEWQVARNYYLSHAWRGQTAPAVSLASNAILSKILQELEAA